MMSADQAAPTTPATRHDGPTRGAQIVALIDRARHDRTFGASLRREPVTTAAQFGLTLYDEEWAGLRDFLYA
jgi:hypothetical protein